MTRATAEVHHFFSEVPQYWELKTRPSQKTDVDKITSCYGMKIPMFPRYTTRPCQIDGLFSDDFGLRNPVIQKTNSQKKVYLYRSTRHTFL